MAMADVGKEGVATDLPVENSPRCDDKGGREGGVAERCPDSGEGVAEVGSSGVPPESLSLGPGRAGGTWAEGQPGRWGVEGKWTVVKVIIRGEANLSGPGQTSRCHSSPALL
jgi:hypothetical protein